MENLEKMLEKQELISNESNVSNYEELESDLKLEETPILASFNDKDIKINLAKMLHNGRITDADISLESDVLLQIENRLNNPNLKDLYNKLKTTPNNYIPSKILKEFDAYDEICTIELEESVRNFMKFSLNAWNKPTQILSGIDSYKKLLILDNKAWKEIAINLLKQWRPIDKVIEEYDVYLDIEKESNLDAKNLMLAFIWNDVPPSWIDCDLCKIIEKYWHEIVEMIIDKIKKQKISEQEALYFAHTYLEKNKE